VSIFVSVDIRNLINLHQFFILKSDAYKRLLLKDLYCNILKFFSDSALNLQDSYFFDILSQICFTVESE